MFIAFKVTPKKALSGKVLQVNESNVEVATKNGIKFTVEKKNILWVKTGSRWPKGVYLLLKGESNVKKQYRKCYCRNL